LRRENSSENLADFTNHFSEARRRPIMGAINNPKKKNSRLDLFRRSGRLL